MESRNVNEMNIQIEIKEEACWMEEAERTFRFEEVVVPNIMLKNEGVTDSSNIEMTKENIAINYEENLDAETNIKEESGCPEQTLALLKSELEKPSVSNTNLHSEINSTTANRPTGLQFVISEDGPLEPTSGEHTQLTPTASTSLDSPQRKEYMPRTVQEINTKTTGKGQHKPATPLMCDVSLDKRPSGQMKCTHILISEDELHQVRLRQEEELHALRLKHAAQIHTLTLQREQKKQDYKRELHAMALEFKQMLLQHEQHLLVIKKQCRN